MPLTPADTAIKMNIMLSNKGEMLSVLGLPQRWSRGTYGVISITHMPDSSADKRRALEATGTFNRRFAAVRHDLFHQGDFFDPQDLLQLKYESLRAVEKDGYSIARASGEFGLSRPTIYQAQSQLQAAGLEGLLPRKRGPRTAHKLTVEICDYLQEQSAAEPRPAARELSRRVRERFKIDLHPRTIEKALQIPGQKRGRPTRR
jgi:transposase